VPQKTSPQDQDKVPLGRFKATQTNLIPYCFEFVENYMSI
jgi:hypothetical protein